MSNHNLISEKQFRNKITLISFICCVMVVYIHAYNVNVYDLNSGVVYSIEQIFSVINSMAVPSFFFISGLLFFRNFNIEDLTKKWKRRLVSIAVPYVLWCIFYYLYFLIISNIFKSITIEGVGTVGLNIKDFMWYLLGGTYHFWFLRKLMLYIVLAPIEWYLLKNRKLKIGVICIIALVIIEIVYPGFLPRGLTLYCCGSYISLNNPEVLLYKNNKLTVLSIFSIVASLVIKSMWFNNELIVIIYILSLWCFIDLFVVENTYLPWWMSITFFIYVAHVAILEPIEKMILILFGKSEVFALIDYVVAPVLTITSLIIVAYLLKKYVNKFWLLINGQRH